MNKTLSSYHWWRWLLLPFAAIGGGYFGAALLALFWWFGMKFQGGYLEDGWMYRFILPLVSSAAFGVLLVVITCVVAPSGKIIAGTVMTTLQTVLTFLLIVITWPFPYTGESTLLIIQSVSSTLVAIVTMVVMHGELSGKNE